MAKANCTQETEASLSYVFHELVILGEAQRFLIQNLPDTNPDCAGLSCALLTFQRRFDELVTSLDKITFNVL